jgi:hypothetical protein
MGHASYLACIRRLHAGKRISPHRPFNLHARVYAGRVYLTASDRSIDTFDCLHEGLSARASELDPHLDKVSTTCGSGWVSEIRLMTHPLSQVVLTALNSLLLD